MRGVRRVSMGWRRSALLRRGLQRESPAAAALSATAAVAAAFTRAVAAPSVGVAAGASWMIEAKLLARCAAVTTHKHRRNGGGSHSGFALLMLRRTSAAAAHLDREATLGSRTVEHCFSLAFRRTYNRETGYTSVLCELNQKNAR